MKLNGICHSRGELAFSIHVETCELPAVSNGLFTVGALSVARDKVSPRIAGKLGDAHRQLSEGGHQSATLLMSPAKFGAIFRAARAGYVSFEATNIITGENLLWGPDHLPEPQAKAVEVQVEEDDWTQVYAAAAEHYRGQTFSMPALDEGIGRPPARQVVITATNANGETVL